MRAAIMALVSFVALAKESEFVIPKKPIKTNAHIKQIKEDLVRESADFLKIKNSFDKQSVNAEATVLELLQEGFDTSFHNVSRQDLKKMLVDIRDLHEMYTKLEKEVAATVEDLNKLLCEKKDIKKQ